MKIDDIIVDLKDNAFIDNNIFGYTYSGIQITNISGCDNINLLYYNIKN